MPRPTLQAVTEYVREEFNRAEALENDGRKGTVGFALTILQRRLASSPEAIYQSLRAAGSGWKSGCARSSFSSVAPRSAGLCWPMLPRLHVRRRLDDLDDAPDAEVEEPRNRSSIRPPPPAPSPNCAGEIAMLRNWKLAQAGPPSPAATANGTNFPGCLQNNTEMFDAHGHRRKLVIFTEHRDTLNYLVDRIRALFGRPRRW
jgi:hypothetical protein